MQIPSLRETAFVFTNCWGWVNVFDDTVKVYLVNSPYLSVRGKDEINWQNIYIDGWTQYEYEVNESIYEGQEKILAFPCDFQDGDDVQIILGGQYGIANISFRFSTDTNVQFNNMIYLTPEFYCTRLTIEAKSRKALIFKDVRNFYFPEGGMPVPDSLHVQKVKIRRYATVFRH